MNLEENHIVIADGKLIFYRLRNKRIIYFAFYLRLCGILGFFNL